MKLILYIGHHKVGSTSLQAFLTQNAQALSADGILYPMVDPRGLVHMLRQSVGLQDKPATLPPHLREPHSALAYRMIADAAHREVPKQFADMPLLKDMVETVRLQVNRLKPHTIILCSEVFSTFGDVRTKLFDPLLALIPDVTQIQVYGVFRRPDHYLVSWHGQCLKAGEKLPPVADTLATYAKTVHLDYRRALSGWLDRCDGAHVTLRNYGDVLETGNSVRDFRKHAMVEWPANLIPPPRINLSLPLPVMEIARRGNHALSRGDAARLVDFLMNARGQLDMIPGAQIDMFGPKARADLLTRFEPVHAYLNRVAGTQAFFPDLANIATCPPVSQYDAVRAVLDQMTPDGPVSALAPPIQSFIAELRLEYGLG